MNSEELSIKLPVGFFLSHSVWLGESLISEPKLHMIGATTFSSLKDLGIQDGRVKRGHTMMKLLKEDVLLSIDQELRSLYSSHDKMHLLQKSSSYEESMMQLLMFPMKSVGVLKTL
jgi:hypothetical protein